MSSQQKLQTQIQNVKNYLLNSSSGQMTELIQNYNSYNTCLNTPSCTNSSTYKQTFLTTINNITNVNGIQQLNDIESLIIKQSNILDISMNAFNNLNPETLSSSNNTANVLKNNFKELYNKQYFKNAELFVGIILISGVVCKMMFYETIDLNKK
jgi:hypothetical protein